MGAVRTLARSIAGDDALLVVPDRSPRGIAKKDAVVDRVGGVAR